MIDEHCTFAFPQIEDTSSYRIVIDDVEWGRTNTMLEGRHGLKVYFRDAGNESVRYPPSPTTRRGVPPARYYQAHIKHKRDLETVLKPLVIEMIQTGALKHPEQAKAEMRERHAERQRLTDAATTEKHERWASKADEVIALFETEIPRNQIDRIRAAIIAAMEWAQKQ